MSLFSSLSPTHAPRADALAGLSYIQSLRGGARTLPADAATTAAAWQAAAPSVAQAAAASHRPSSASRPRGSSVSPSRVSLPQPSREKHNEIVSSAAVAATTSKSQQRGSYAGTNSGAAGVAPSVLASPLHQFFSAHSSPPPGFSAAAHNDSLSGWTESDGAEEQLRDSRKPSATDSASKRPAPSAVGKANAAPSASPASGSFTARPPSKPRAENLTSSSGASTSRLANSHSGGMLEEKEASSARVSAIARAARLSQAPAPKKAAAVAPFFPFAQSSPTALPRFQTAASAGSRTLEDEMLELENERRRRNKQRAAEGDSPQRSQQQQQEEKSTVLLPKINGAEQQQQQRADPLTSTGGAVAAAHAASASLLSGLPLPVLPASCSDGSALSIDWVSHTALFSEQLSSYTHRLTLALQSNLDKVMSKIRLNESAKLSSTRHQIREMMRFYHAHEGPLYDVCLSNKDAERTLQLLELESEELSKQTSLIREDFDSQRAGLVAQLQSLHSGQRIHHEYLVAHSKNPEGAGHAQKQRTRRPSRNNAGAAPAVDRAVSPGVGSGSEPSAQQHHSPALKPLAPSDSSTPGAGRSRGASRGDSRAGRPHSRGMLSVGSQDDDVPVPAAAAASNAHEAALVKIGVLRSYWQHQFVSVRLLREELARVRAQVANLDVELGHRLEEEQLRADGLAGQLAQMQVNHEEALAVRAEELTALQDEAARLAAKHEALSAESDALHAAAASCIAKEEEAWRDIEASQSARTELARANDAVKAELEHRFCEQQRVRLSAVHMSQEAFSWARQRLLAAVSCPDCGSQLQAATVTWTTGESSCESCAFRKLFPPAFQAVVHNMHRALTNQTAAAAAARGKGQARKQQRQSGSSTSFLEDLSSMGGTSSEDTTQHSTPSLSRLQSSVLSGLGKEHFESASVTAARRLAQQADAASAAAAAAVVSESTGLGELGTRLLASMARTLANTSADDDDEDLEASAAAASVGDRIRRGSLGGIVDALTAMNEAAAAAKKADSAAVTSDSNKPTPPSVDRSLAGAAGSALAASADAPALSASASAVSFAASSALASPAPTLLWLRNRTVDLFLARLAAYRGSLDALSAHARAVQPLMDAFESSLSSAHQERMEVERSAERTAR